MKDMKIYILGIFIVLFSLPCLSQTYDYKRKYTDPNRTDSDLFSFAVDVKGDYLVVTNTGDDEDSNELSSLDSAGSALIYVKRGDEWVINQKIVAYDRAAGDAFGTAAKMQGDELFISAVFNGLDSLGNNFLSESGALYVYTRDSQGQYISSQKIVPFDRNGSENYGTSIDVHGEWLVVGAIYEDKDASGVAPPLGAEPGAAYVYRKNSGNGNWDFFQKLSHPSRNDLDRYGFSCAVYNNQIIVGAYSQDYDLAEANYVENGGAAYAYRFDGTNWVYENKMIRASRVEGDNFGYSLDIYEDKMVICAPFKVLNAGTNNNGVIDVYKLVGNNWVSNQSTLIYPHALLSFPADFNRIGAFGGSVVMKEDKFFVSAPGESNFFSSPTRISSGVVFQYDLVGTTYALVNEFAAPEQHDYAIFGFPLAVDDNVLLVGAPGDTKDSLDQGAVMDSAGAFYIFEQCIHASVPQITPINSSICIGDSVQLVVNPNGSLNSSKEWYWYTGAYATGTLIDSTDTIWVKPTVTTTYSVAGEGYCIASNLSDSFSTVTVTVNPLPIVTATSTPGTTVCSGENVTLTGGGASTYIWDNSIADGVGFIPSGIGTTTYKVIGTDVNGCVDSTTIDVTVSNSITVGINYTGGNPICSGTSVTLSGTGASSYSWSPAITDGSAFTPLVTNTYTVTGTSASGCTATADTTITVVAGPNITVTAGVTSICEGESVTISATGADSYAWTGLGAGQSQNVTPLVTTTYVVIGTQASTMCTDIDSIEITVNPLPNVVATAQPNDSLCLGESLTLVSGAPNPVWNNGVFENVVFVPTLGSVDYIATSTDVNGCVNKDTVNVKVFSLPVVSASVSSPGAICSGDLVTLNGFGALSYVWDSSGVDIGILNGVPFMPSSGMNVFTVTGTDVNGCVGTATQSLTVNESPSVSAFSSAGGLALCDGESVSLTATGNGQSYSWNNGVTDGVNFVPPVGSTLYVVTATSANQCTSTAGITLVVNEQEDATIAPVLPLCGGVPIETLSTVTSGGVWQGIGVNALTGEFDASVAGQGVHQIIYTTSGACDDADTINIEVYPELIVNTYGDSVCFGDQDGDISVEVIQGLAPYTYLWDNDETTSAISDLGEGIYSIEVKDGNNCIVNLNIDVLLTESCDYHVFLPNVFSPNGDGSNDVFYARGKGFESLILVVYDRWGNKLFETTDKYLGWDGTKNGKPVDAGVYVYYVKAEYYDGTEEIIEGNICVAY